MLYGKRWLHESEARIRLGSRCIKTPSKSEEGKVACRRCGIKFMPTSEHDACPACSRATREP